MIYLLTAGRCSPKNTVIQHNHQNHHHNQHHHHHHHHQYHQQALLQVHTVILSIVKYHMCGPAVVFRLYEDDQQFCKLMIFKRAKGISQKGEWM